MLQLKGIDSVASIYLNEKPILETRSQFVEYAVSAKSLVIESGNKLHIFFDSSVRYAESEAKNYLVSML